ncbi:hypothetical protein [Maledivibacter halophilus]|uniref:Uncharacterized protein n=1 Tax=Maledivibacter halophilus TaxID=36842 RepID=A0A1T5LJ25_9FIRM|nr:hypothetical protein [Maledivibacter halophilus]SKC75970.1 hypothetical protein SAMN02194393_02927 [Maledivibacter halophilus]
MIEKLKDFFYDCSDTLLSLFILLVMVFVITWKLSGVMSIPLFADSTDTYDPAINKPIEANVSDTENNSIPLEESQEENPGTAINQEPAKSNDDDEVEVVVVEGEDITVEIPKGTVGNGIAQILKEKSLIESTSEFIDRVEELKLGPKLRYGTFTIKSNSSIDKIISIITGVTINN